MAHNRNCTCRDCKSGENAVPSLTEQAEWYYQKTGYPIGSSRESDAVHEADLRRTVNKLVNSPNGW